MMLHITRKHILKSASALLCAGALLFPLFSSAAAFQPNDWGTSAGAVGSEGIQPGEEEFNDGIAIDLEALKAEDSEEEFIPHVWPVRFSEVGHLSSGYGYRLDPVTGESSEFHAGIDLADKPNTKIHASASGTVTEAKESSGYGLTILIDHGNGYTSRYSHCSSLLVDVGDEVSQGQVIALMGATGRATGVHLDFRVYVDGSTIDPLTVLDEMELPER